jgi:hypothetical protein
MNFDECKAKTEQGIPCQMKLPNGKWVNFDPSLVITEFKEAPLLGPTDGARVLLFVLHGIEKILEDRFSLSGLQVKLPEHGPKKDWSITERVSVSLGATCITPSHTRYRDIFKSYFRVVKRSANDPTVYHGRICNPVPGTPIYVVERRNLYEHDGWTPVFHLKYMPFKPDEKFRPLNEVNAGDTCDWWIHCDAHSFVGATTKPTSDFDRLKKVPGASEWADDAVTFQRIQTLDPVHNPGGDAIFNIAAFMAHYLMIISDLDSRAGEIANVIENHVGSNPGISYRIGEKLENGRSPVYYRLGTAFRAYCNAAYPRDEHVCWSRSENQMKAILLRYFNDLYRNIQDIHFEGDK